MLRGISGGERKRLSVATELLMDPPLLFIDEPTSGLDSFMAENIVTQIAALARASRTVLCTIHQPTSEVFDLFDRVCLVAEGEIVFMGARSEALEHFSSAGFPCRTNFNPADHYIFTLAIRPGAEDACKHRCQGLLEHYKTSETYKSMIRRVEASNSEEVVVKDLSRKRMQSSICTQVGENFKRSVKNIIRNPAYIKSRVVQSIVVGVLMGLAYFNTQNDQRAAQNKSGALFNIIVYFTFGNVAIQTMSIPAELHVIKREYQNGMYSTLPYFLSKVISELPYISGLPLLTMAICYFMIGLRSDVLAFFTNVAAIAGISWAGTGLGWFLSTWTGDAALASALVAPVVMPFFLFGGLYQNDESTPVYFEPVKYVSWFRYGFNMLMANEFLGVTNISCPVNQQPCVFHNGTDILAHYAIDPGAIWWPNMVIMFSIGAVLCFFAWTCLICRIRR